MILEEHACKKEEAEGRKEGRKNVKLFALPLLHTIWWWCLNDNIQSDSGKYHRTCAALILNKSTIHRIDTAPLDGNMIGREEKYNHPPNLPRLNLKVSHLTWKFPWLSWKFSRLTWSALCILFSWNEGEASENRGFDQLWSFSEFPHCAHPVSQCTRWVLLSVLTS